jgi:hypothetical protein
MLKKVSLFHTLVFSNFIFRPVHSLEDLGIGWLFMNPWKWLVPRYSISDPGKVQPWRNWAVVSNPRKWLRDWKPTIITANRK